MRESNTVLYVEDDPLLLEAISDKFTSEKFTVFSAKNGVEGLTIALGQHPSCILLDIIMPTMDGFAMLKKLRADTWGATVPVIVLSNLGASQDVAKAKKYGVKQFIIKANCPLKDIVSKVKMAIGD